MWRYLVCNATCTRRILCHMHMLPCYNICVICRLPVGTPTPLPLMTRELPSPGETGTMGSSDTRYVKLIVNKIINAKCC